MFLLRHSLSVPSKVFSQRGVVLPLFAVSLLVLIAVSGLALDTGHWFVNKTRLQNAVDAAALSAAKTWDLSGSTARADAAGLATFNSLVALSGNQELAAAGLVPVFTYSPTANPFAAGAVGPFVRVTVTNLDTASFFLGVVGVDTTSIGASAVAGPSTVLASPVSGVAPILVCADTGAADFGYPPGVATILTHGVANIGTPLTVGNYVNLSLNCGTVNTCVSTQIAGAFNRGLSTGTSEDAMSPPHDPIANADGLNTRFDCTTLGCSDYPSDKVTTQGTLADYRNAYGFESWTNASGMENRRMLVAPLGDCSGAAASTSIPIVGFGCFFLTDRASDIGQIFIEPTDKCLGQGVPGQNFAASPGPHTIVLYRDFIRSDS